MLMHRSAMLAKHASLQAACKYASCDAGLALCLISRMLHAIAGHAVDESVLSLAVSPDSTYFVTADSGGLVKSWSLEALATFWRTHSTHGDAAPANLLVNVAAWHAHTAGVSSVAFVGTDQQLLLTSGFDKQVALWNVHGACLGILGQVSLPLVA